MDFLDPSAKRKHGIRLIIGYALVGILIATATLILVFQAYGFDLDRKTGEVIQNGLVYVDSAPDKASIVLNGQVREEKTNSRLRLPAGSYNLEIKKEGYRDWKRSFDLDGGFIERITYPMLIPNDLTREEIQTFDAPAGFASESPDRRWAMVSKGGSLREFTEYDLNAVSNKKPDQRDIVFPAELFKAAEGAHSLELVEWSTDNKHLLVKHAFQGGHEFIVLAREAPTASININNLLKQNPTNVTLRDKKFDQWYLYAAAGGVLQTVEAKNPTVITPLLANVTAYKTHDDDTLVYSQPMSDGKNQRITLQEGLDSYTLREVPMGTVLLEIARFDGSWYVVVGVDAEQKTYIYKNPLTTLSKRDGTKAVPRAVLKATGALTQVSFSQNTRFILTQSGQHFEVFDAEFSEIFRHDVPTLFDPNTKVVWMDGHRMLGRSAGKLVMFDFDGSNRQELVPAHPLLPVFFDRDYTVIYSLSDSTLSPGKAAMMRTDLRIDTSVTKFGPWRLARAQQ